MSSRKIKASDVFENFLLLHYSNNLMEILAASNEDDDYSIIINFQLLFEEHIEVSQAVLVSPLKLLNVFDEAFFKALMKKFVEEKEKTDDLSLKHKVHIRLSGLPRCKELYRHAIPNANDIGHIVCISGTVVRVTGPKLLELQREYVCLKCKYEFTVKADYTMYYQINKPQRCCSPKKCYSSAFKVKETASKFLFTKDYQEIKLQEQVQKLILGTIPRSIWLTLEDDLVNSVMPGDDVSVCGIVLQRWQTLVKGSRPSIDLVIKVNNISVHNKQRSHNILTEEALSDFNLFWENHHYDPLSGRNQILASFCPQVHGLYVVKLAIVIVLAGGVQLIDASGTTTRGESHILLVGDPGTGKSQFLKYVANLVPRCVLTTGIGTTSAGLTVAAVKEDGEWALEAGALVLADGGICCIDEFNSVKEADRAAIHEAMEQQTLSVAKAGLVCKLNTRCTVLAATNPKGRYDSNEPLTVNVALSSPLLSRFDVIFVLLDSTNEQWDKVVSDFILKGCNPNNASFGNGGSCHWSIDKLRSYICHVRSLQPKMSDNAHLILKKYFQLLRQNDGRSQARTTIRMLESLVRLSQGHARLMMKEDVSTLDAIVAITLMESSMCGTSLLTGIDPLHTAFPHSPKDEYRKQIQIILQKFDLLNILNEEMVRLKEEEVNNSAFQRSKNVVSPAKTQVSKDKGDSTIQSNWVRRCLTLDRGQLPNIIELNEDTSNRKGRREDIRKCLKKRTIISSSESGDSDKESTILQGGLDVSLDVLMDETIDKRKKASKNRKNSLPEKCITSEPVEASSSKDVPKNKSIKTNAKKRKSVCRNSKQNIPYHNNEIVMSNGTVSNVTKTSSFDFDSSLDKASRDILDFDDDFVTEAAHLKLGSNDKTIQDASTSLSSSILRIQRGSLAKNHNNPQQPSNKLLCPKSGVKKKSNIRFSNSSIDCSVLNSRLDPGADDSLSLSNESSIVSPNIDKLNLANFEYKKNPSKLFKSRNSSKIISYGVTNSLAVNDTTNIFDLEVSDSNCFNISPEFKERSMRDVVESTNEPVRLNTIDICSEATDSSESEIKSQLNQCANVSNKLTPERNSLTTTTSVTCNSSPLISLNSSYIDKLKKFSFLSSPKPTVNSLPAYSSTPKLNNEKITSPTSDRLSDEPKDEVEFTTNSKISPSQEIRHTPAIGVDTIGCINQSQVSATPILPFFSRSNSTLSFNTFSSLVSQYGNASLTPSACNSNDLSKKLQNIFSSCSRTKTNKYNIESDEEELDFNLDT